MPPAPVPTVVQITANATQTAARNTPYLQVTARLLDQNGAGFAGATMNMHCPLGRGAFTGGGLDRSAVTDANGYVLFPAIIASSTLGTFAPSVSYTGLAQVNASFTTIDPAIATAIAVSSGSGQSALTGALFANRLVIRVANAANAPVPGVTVTFDAPNAGASIVWTLPATDPTAAVSDASGLATSPTFSANATAGTYNVAATAPGIAGSALFQLTNGAAPAPPPASAALQMCEA